MRYSGKEADDSEQGLRRKTVKKKRAFNENRRRWKSFKKKKKETWHARTKLDESRFKG